MDDREQKLRETAYRIWEEAGRPEGQDSEHWRHAEEQHEASERQAEDAARRNGDASERVAKGESAPTPRDPTDRPPSVAAPD